MSRPSRVQTYMEIAQAWAKRATCHRLNVGAVIVARRTIISHGYNGVPAGMPHCRGNVCPGRFECKETIHAEKNAIDRLPVEFKGAVLPTEMDMYCTDSPCPACAEVILTAGVRRVFFATPYRITESLDWLIQNGIYVYRVTSAGYIIDWETKDVMDIEV